MEGYCRGCKVLRKLRKMRGDLLCCPGAGRQAGRQQLIGGGAAGLQTAGQVHTLIGLISLKYLIGGFLPSVSSASIFNED